MQEPDLPTGRLRWKCRRGMRELDVLLTGFLDGCYEKLEPAMKVQFAELLDRQDPEIWAYMLGRSEPGPELAGIVQRIRDFSSR